MQNLLEQLISIVGTSHVLTAPEVTAPFLTDGRGRYHGRALCVVRPANTPQVAAVVKACVEAHTPIVPQGGNTSHCGAATPDETGKAVLLSLSRLNRILELDPRNNTLMLEAGCTLQEAQEAARSVGRLFPLSLAAEGSCQIGGNLSTNAGGVHVLRYGNTRELTLGLEVVLPDGQVWNGLRALRKDNTGYDLKQWFIGAEGTLGIITAAVLKLFPMPASQQVCWLNVVSPEASVELLASARTAFDAQLTAFELVSEPALGLVLKHFTNARRPTPSSPWYVLAEFSGSEQQAVEAWFSECMAAGLLVDGVLAQSEQQGQSLWALREWISEAQKREGISIKHDISVPVSSLPAFLEKAGEMLEKKFPGVRVVAFGHVGDGNLHYNLSMPEALNNAAFIAMQPQINACVHDLVAAMQGSISAEHGIGQLKRTELLRYKSPLEIALMQKLKQALDPQGLMNPGKVL